MTGLFAAVFAVSWGLTAVVVALLAGTSVLIFRGPLDRPDLLAPALVMLLQFLLFVNPGWNLENVFSAFRAGGSLFWIRLGESLVVLVASVVAGLIEKDVWALVLATGLGAACTLVQRVWLVRPWMALRTSRDALRDAFSRVPEILRFGLKLAPGNLAEGISYDAPIWVLGLSLPAAAVGAYSRAWQTANRLYASGYRVNEMLLPTLVERIGEHDHDAFERTLLDTARYAAIALLLVGAAAGGAAEGVMHIFGPGFAAGSNALAILLVTPALTVVAGIEAQAQYALDRPWASTVAAVVGMVAKVAGVIVLTETQRPHRRGGRLRGGDAAAVRAPDHRRGATPARARAPLASAPPGGGDPRRLRRRLRRRAGRRPRARRAARPAGWAGRRERRVPRRLRRRRGPARRATASGSSRHAAVSARAGGRRALAREPVAAPTHAAPRSGPAPRPRPGSLAARRGATRAGGR